MEIVRLKEQSEKLWETVYMLLPLGGKDYSNAMWYFDAALGMMESLRIVRKREEELTLGEERTERLTYTLTFPRIRDRNHGLVLLLMQNERLGIIIPVHGKPELVVQPYDQTVTRKDLIDSIMWAVGTSVW